MQPAPAATKLNTMPTSALVALVIVVVCVPAIFSSLPAAALAMLHAEMQLPAVDVWSVRLRTPFQLTAVFLIP